jgi:RNA polymerase sigma factor (sigma-70 family)
MVRKHLPLVRRIAWHVHGSMSSIVEVEDLIQIGMVALIEAVNGFEDRGAVTFEQYLMTRVRGAMIDELRRQATLTRGAMRRRKAYQESVSSRSRPNWAAPRARTSRREAGRDGGEAARRICQRGSGALRFDRRYVFGRIALVHVRGAQCLRPARRQRPARRADRGDPSCPSARRR